MSEIRAVLVQVLLNVPGLLFMAAIDVSWAIASACSLIVGIMGGLLASTGEPSLVTLFGGNLGTLGPTTSTCGNEPHSSVTSAVDEELIEV